MVETNHDILLIIYRYKWQTLVNRINGEYFKIYKLNPKCFVSTKISLEFVKQAYIKHKKVYNYRNLHKTRGIGITFIKNQKIGFVENNRQNLENYAFTSTKYLREIKESGINCLSIIDNA